MSTKKTETSSLPKGMELVSDGSLSESHNFTAEPIVHGVVVTQKAVQIQRGKVLEDNRMLGIDVGDKTVTVWESASLEDLFDTAVVGDEVYIKLTGSVDLKNGLNPMKTFVTGIKKGG